MTVILVVKFVFSIRYVYNTQKDLVNFASNHRCSFVFSKGYVCNVLKLHPNVLLPPTHITFR
jgi:hypothetical protein